MNSIELTFYIYTSRWPVAGWVSRISSYGWSYRFNSLSWSWYQILSLVAAWLNHQSLVLVSRCINWLPCILEMTNWLLNSRVSLVSTFSSSVLLLAHQPNWQLSNINRYIWTCMHILLVDDVVNLLLSRLTWCLVLNRPESSSIAGGWHCNLLLS
jgi:hypothetical protein